MTATEMETAAPPPPRGRGRRSLRGLFSFRRGGKSRGHKRVEEEDESPATPTKLEIPPVGPEGDGRTDGTVTPPLSPLQEDDDDDDGTESADERAPLTEADYARSSTREGVPVISSIMADRFRPSEVGEERASAAVGPSSPGGIGKGVSWDGGDGEMINKGISWEGGDSAVGASSSQRRGKGGGSSTTKEGGGGGSVSTAKDFAGLAKNRSYASNTTHTASTTASSIRSRRSAAQRRKTIKLEKPPTARQAAFGGPPRYDWIDIETAAAVKVQAAYRRNKVMWELEKEGKSTAAMRNRMRARRSQRKSMVSDDVPFPLACCGVGFLFGDATAEDQAVLDLAAKKKYEERKKREEEEEARRRKLRYRKKPSQMVVEEYEVIDDQEDEEEDN